MTGSHSYDFLGDSFLFGDELVAESFASVSDADLERELQRYRAFIDAAPIVVRNTSRTRILAGTGAADLQLLSQCAWYVEEFIVRDPLYELTRQRPGQGSIDKYLGLKRPTTEETRQGVVKAVQLMRTLLPMVVAGYVRVLPISRVFEPPSEVPLTAYPDGGANLLPSRIMEWFKQRALISRVEIRDGMMLFFDEDVRSSPRRTIGLEFQAQSGDLAGGWDLERDPTAVYMYSLMDQRLASFDDSTRIAEFVMDVPEEPPSKESYDAWVNQSIHQSAAAFADRAIREVRLADELQARFLTRSPLTAAFLSVAAPGRPTGKIVETTINAIMNLDVPFLDGIQIDDLMRVRQEDGEAFASFRNALEKELRGLELENNPDVARAKAEHVRHELATVQLAAIDNQIKRYRRKAFADSLLALGSLSATVPTGGLSLIATAKAATSLAKAKFDYDASVKNHPAYFLWRVRKRARS